MDVAAGPVCVELRGWCGVCVQSEACSLKRGGSALFLSTPQWLSALITFDKRGLLNPNYPELCLSWSPSPFLPSAWRVRSFQSSSSEINWPRLRFSSRLLTSFGNQRSSLVRARMSGRQRDSCASGVSAVMWLSPKWHRAVVVHGARVSYAEVPATRLAEGRRCLWVDSLTVRKWWTREFCWLVESATPFLEKLGRCSKWQ